MSFRLCLTYVQVGNVPLSAHGPLPVFSNLTSQRAEPGPAAHTRVPPQGLSWRDAGHCQVKEGRTFDCLFLPLQLLLQCPQSQPWERTQGQGIRPRGFHQPLHCYPLPILPVASSSSATCCHPWTHVRYGAFPHPGGGGDQGNPVVQDHGFESPRLWEPIICNPGREVGAGWMSLQKATVSTGCTTAQWHLLQTFPPQPAPFLRWESPDRNKGPIWEI